MSEEGEEEEEEDSYTYAIAARPSRSAEWVGLQGSLVGSPYAQHKQGNQSGSEIESLQQYHRQGDGNERTIRVLTPQTAKLPRKGGEGSELTSDARGVN
jgi:hypothetical protein